MSAPAMKCHTQYVYHARRHTLKGLLKTLIIKEMGGNYNFWGERKLYAKLGKKWKIISRASSSKKLTKVLLLTKSWFLRTLRVIKTNILTKIRLKMVFLGYNLLVTYIAK